MSEDEKCIEIRKGGIGHNEVVPAIVIMTPDGLRVASRAPLGVCPDGHVEVIGEHFEVRHRALRKPVTKTTPPPNESAWTQVDMQALLAFDMQTAPMVDDLVAAVREMSRYEDRYEHCRGIDWAAYDRAVAALAALDEASR